MSYRIGIDIGGTFTDFALFGAAGRTLAIHKQLTTPADPSQAVIEGVDALLRRSDVAITAIDEIVHGTTLVTNAVIERRGAVTGMLTTAGFRDILDMREEKRYDVFDLRITYPDPIVPRNRRREVSERTHFDGTVETAVDVDGAVQAARALRDEEGIEALAVCFLHAYANPAHEMAVAGAIREALPELHLCTSGEVFPGRREYDRFTTACINAYTQPLFDRYLTRLEEGLSGLGFGGRFYVMSSSGGTLAPDVARRFPVRVVESGPAAGAQMSVFHGEALGKPDLLSFDMGGTTAKGALVRDGQALKVYGHEVARQHDFKAGSGLPVRSPVIDMIEIGAGGGSIAEVDARGTIKVGPRSASADPGPACYGRDGQEATLTDANLLLGYLDPTFFLGGQMSLDKQAAERALAARIAAPLSLEVERAAWGIHEIICEDVARAFRIHASERGFDYRGSSMIGFGGSGPLHALRVARKLRIPQVVFPVAAGVMSALGLLASPLSFEVARTRERFVADLNDADFEATFAELSTQAREPLLGTGLEANDIQIIRQLDMRYHGQGHEIAVTVPPGTGLSELPALFRAQYESLYQFSYLDAPLVITNWKVEARGPAAALSSGYQLSDIDSGQASTQSHEAIKGRRRAYFGDEGGWHDTAVYDRYALAPGATVEGPALIEERESTVVVGPRDSVAVDAAFNLIASLGAAAAQEN